MRVDVHQHIWSEQLVAALQAREELPFVRREHGLAVLYLAGERPCVLDMLGEAPAARGALVERDGLDRALVCLSSPLGIESLRREQAEPLLDAYHDGALALDGRFGVWGAVALDRAAGERRRSAARARLCRALAAGMRARRRRRARSLEPAAGAPRRGRRAAARASRAGARSHASLLSRSSEPSLGEPLWWPALTRYVAEMQAAWLTFVSAGRSEHPRLRVIFTMLAGLAPLQAERLAARGGPAPLGRRSAAVLRDLLLRRRLGQAARRGRRRRAAAVRLRPAGRRPARARRAPHELDWDAIADATRRALERRRPATLDGRRAEPTSSIGRRRAGALLR